MNALAMVIGFIASAVGIWLAGSLLGRVTDPMALLAWSLGIGIVCGVILAVFRSSRA